MYPSSQHGSQHTGIGVVGLLSGLISIAAYMGYLDNITVDHNILFLISAILSVVCGFLLMMQGWTQRRAY